jgi:hypothetical protein
MRTKAGIALAVWLAVQPPAPGAAGEADPTVALDRSCYSPREPISEIGRGFNAGARVGESLTLLSPLTGRLFGPLVAPDVVAGPEGAFNRSIRAPRLGRRGDRREQAFSVFTDQADPQGSWTSVEWTLTAWDVDIEAWDSGNASRRGTMVVDSYGWTSAGSTLYAHYLRRGRRVADVRLGRLTGACGDFRKRVRQFPFRTVRRGRWTVFFSVTPRLDKRADAWISYTVRMP